MLTFRDPEAEIAFREEVSLRLSRRLRIYLPLLIIAIMLGSAIVYGLYPALSVALFGALVVLFVLAPLLLAWWRVLRRSQLASVYTLTLYSFLGAIIGIILSTAAYRAFGFPVTNEPLMAMMVSLFIVTGLRFHHNVLLGFVALGGIVAIEWVYPVSLAESITKSFYSAILFLTGTAMNLLLERSARKEFLARRELADLAVRDTLTGLLNRRGMHERYPLVAAAAYREECAVSLAVLDIDHFKQYNDTYGHDAGDKVIAAVAAVVSRFTRRPLDFCVRLGGEEFLIVWHDADESIAAMLAGDLVSEIRSLCLPHAGSPLIGVVSVSIGTATTRDPRDFEALYKEADGNLYRAKQSGRNRAMPAPGRNACGEP